MTVLDSVSLTTETVLAAVHAYFANHKEGIVAVALLCAAILTFAGRTLLRPTVFLLGFLPTFLVVAAFGLAIANEQDPDHSARSLSVAKGVALAVALLFALLMGSLVVGLLFRAATFFLCAAFGAILVLLLNLFLLQPSISRDALIAWYAAMLLVALATGVLSIRYPDTCITLATSFDGAALAVFSLAHFLGHQPHLLSGAVNKSMDEYWAVSYAATTVLLGVLGASTQRNAAPIAALAPHTPSRPTSPVLRDVEHALPAPSASAPSQHGGSVSGYGNAPTTSSPHNHRANSDYVDATAHSVRLPFHKNLNSPSPFASAPHYMLPPSDEAAHLLPPDRPNTPPYAGSHDGAAAAPGGYGTADDGDLQYTVLPNLSAPPLGADGAAGNNADPPGPNGAPGIPPQNGAGHHTAQSVPKHASSALR